MWSIALNYPVQAIGAQSGFCCAWVLAQPSEVKAWMAASVAAEEKLVLAAVEVQKKPSCT